MSTEYNSLLSHPVIQRLRQERLELSTYLGSLLEEWRVIREEVNPKLLAVYDHHFRSLEIELQHKTVEEKRLARQEELFRMKLERGEQLTQHNIRLIFALVEKEFQRLQWQVEELLDIDNGTSKTSNSSAYTAQDIAQLYRSIVKKLHPDATSGTSDAQYDKFWSGAQEAYKTRNAERLRSIYEMVCASEELQVEPFDTFDLVEDALYREIERLEGRIASEEKKLQNLKNSDPYCLRESLYNEQWLAEHRAMLEGDLRTIEHNIAQHTAFLHSILGDNWQQSAELPNTAKERQSFQEEFASATYFNKR